MKKIIVLFIIILNLICRVNAVYSQEATTNLSSAVAVNTAKTDSAADTAIIAKENYKKQIMSLISANLPQKRKFYGKIVEVRLTLDKYGGLVNLDLTRSSGDTKYDQAAIASINRIMFPVFPPEIGNGDITLTYRIQCRKNITLDNSYYAYYTRPWYSPYYRDYQYGYVPVSDIRSEKRTAILEGLLAGALIASVFCGESRYHHHHYYNHHYYHHHY